jgi:hypothetical protein
MLGECADKMWGMNHAYADDSTDRVEKLKRAHGCYPNDADGSPYDEVLLDVQTAVERSGSVGKYEIGAFMLWKRLNLSSRWTRELNNMRDQQVRAITAVAISLARDRGFAIPEAASVARDALTKLPGCRHGHAVASTILTAGAPDRMAVYDVRALAALKGLGCQDPVGNYRKYMTTVVDLVAEINSRRGLSWCPRDVDKALYMLSDS